MFDESESSTDSNSEDEELSNELNIYLQHKIEKVKDPVQWWFEHRTAYLHLSRMALDYLTIPGMLSIMPFHVID